MFFNYRFSKLIFLGTSLMFTHSNKNINNYADLREPYTQHEHEHEHEHEHRHEFELCEMEERVCFHVKQVYQFDQFRR